MTREQLPSLQRCVPPRGNSPHTRFMSRTQLIKGGNRLVPCMWCLHIVSVNTRCIRTCWKPLPRVAAIAASTAVGFCAQRSFHRVHYTYMRSASSMRLLLGRATRSLLPSQPAALRRGTSPSRWSLLYYRTSARACGSPTGGSSHLLVGSCCTASFSEGVPSSGPQVHRLDV